MCFTSEYSKTLFIQSDLNERQLVFMLGYFKLPKFFVTLPCCGAGCCPDML